MSCAYVNINPKKTQEGGAKDNTEINKLFQNIIGNKPVVVLYFANWCQHCTNMKPEWENAIDDLNIEKFNSPKKVIHGDFNKYIIALEDGSYDKNKCPDVDKNVRGFPTINYYPDKKDASLESFEGERKKEDIKDWLNDKLDLGSVQSIPNHTGGNPQKGGTLTETKKLALNARLMWVEDKLAKTTDGNILWTDCLAEVRAKREAPLWPVQMERCLLKKKSDIMDNYIPNHGGRRRRRKSRKSRRKSRKTKRRKRRKSRKSKRRR